MFIKRPKKTNSYWWGARALSFSHSANKTKSATALILVCILASVCYAREEVIDPTASFPGSFFFVSRERKRGWERGCRLDRLKSRKVLSLHQEAKSSVICDVHSLPHRKILRPIIIVFDDIWPVWTWIAFSAGDFWQLQLARRIGRNIGQDGGRACAFRP